MTAWLMGWLLVAQVAPLGPESGVVSDTDGADASGESAEADPGSAAETAEAQDGEPDPAAQEGAGLPGPSRSSRSRATLHETFGDVDPPAGDCEADESGAACPPAPEAPFLLRPTWLEPPSQVGALLLGLGVGFGTGLFYAQDPIQGLIFALGDGVLWAGLVGAVAVFNQIVIRNDFTTLRSLARGERTLTQSEQVTFALSWVIGGVLALSHGYQGLAGYFAASDAAQRLDDIAIVPLSGGAAFSTRWRF